MPALRDAQYRRIRTLQRVDFDLAEFTTPLSLATPAASFAQPMLVTEGAWLALARRSDYIWAGWSPVGHDSEALETRWPRRNPTTRW
jgi:hypothetical protein